MLNDEEVRAIAAEARLSLHGDELAKAVRYINNFLGMVDRFKELDLKDVPPFCFAESTECPLREDVAAPFPRVPDILAARSQSLDYAGAFRVPRIVEE